MRFYPLSAFAVFHWVLSFARSPQQYEADGCVYDDWEYRYCFNWEGTLAASNHLLKGLACGFELQTRIAKENLDGLNIHRGGNSTEVAHGQMSRLGNNKQDSLELNLESPIPCPGNLGCSRPGLGRNP